MNRDCACMWCKDPDKADAKLIAIIAEYGHAVIPVIGTDPEITFTIGMFHTYGHPEIILLGLPVKHAFPLLNNCGAMIKNGEVIEPGKSYDGLASLPSVFRTVDKHKASEYLGRCISFYGGIAPPALQYVWPDPAGNFPWDRDWNHKYDRKQPQLWSALH